MAEKYVCNACDTLNKLSDRFIFVFLDVESTQISEERMNVLNMFPT